MTRSLLPARERSRWASATALAGFAGLTAAAAIVGGRVTAQSVDGWYAGLDKPAFTPPNWVFGPVWTGLYVLVAWSGWRVWLARPSRRRTFGLALWAGQLVANAAWSPLFFGLHRPRAALVDLMVLAGSAVAYTVVVRRVDRGAAAMMLPYLGWIGFAGALNTAIVWRNP